MGDSHNEVIALARAIAQHLPGYGAEPGNYSHGALLVGENGAKMFLHNSRSGPGKLHISGEYPKDEGTCYMSPRDWGAIPYGETAPEINVSTTRDPAAIAKDISRRFLPLYLPILAKCQERQAERDQARTDARSDIDKIAAALGVPSPDPARTDSLSPSLSFHSDVGYGSFSTSKAELRSLPLAALLEIAKVVKTYCKQVR